MSSLRVENSGRLSKARIAALNAIMDIRKNEAFARDVLNKTLNDHVLSGADRAFAAKLTLGVTQTLGTLDDVIYRCVDSPDDIKSNVMDCLRISTYEIIYLEKEPHAAVDQGVELVKAVEPRARGLANLVLRRVVKIKRDFPFGNPDEDTEAFARIYAIPKWECELIFKSIGENAGRYLISSSNGAPPAYVFVNSIKSRRDEVFEILKAAEAKPSVVEALCGIKLTGCIRVENSAALNNTEIKQAMMMGKFSISDAASQAVATHAMQAFENPQTMLEVCAGKGTKTLMFQSLANEKWGHQMDLCTVDNVEAKTKILRERAKRYGVKLTRTLTADASSDTAFKRAIGQAKYDVVFVDTPCSGLGTLRRHPELKWRLTEKKINQMASTSFKILTNAAKHVVEGGVLTYATCTVTNAENEDVVERFLKSPLGQKFQLLPYQVDDKQMPYFRTQTFSGLNDSHFSATFKRI